MKQKKEQNDLTKNKKVLEDKLMEVSEKNSLEINYKNNFSNIFFSFLPDY